jgi:hypothetical protein
VSASLSIALVCALAALPAFAAPAPPRDQVVTGTVVDPQGQPIAGAAAWLLSDDFAD